VTYDVVVVGAGAGGLTGALRAADAGLSVLVLEKSEVLGGTAALTGGGLWAPGNQYLEPEDPNLAIDYLDHTVGDRTPREMRLAFLAAAAPTIAWLGEKGIAFAWMQGFPDYFPEQPGGKMTGRVIAPKGMPAERVALLEHPIRPKLTAGDGGPVLRAMDTKGRLFGGQALAAQLVLACEEAGVQFRLSTPMTDLVLENGAVVGVQTDGGEIRANRGVLLASGGIDRSPELRTRWQDPSVGHATWSLGVPTNTGDGIVAGISAGAATDLLEDAWWTPGFVRPDGQVSFVFWERSAPLGFLVDQTGRRWINEGLPYDRFGHAMLAAHQAGTPCIPSWLVFDHHGLTRYGFGGLAADADPDPWVEAGVLVRAESLEELARAIGAPELKATTQRWNEQAEKGADTDFGRGADSSFERQSLRVFQSYPGIYSEPHRWPNPSLAPLLEAPFYAAQIVLADLGTKGGLVCDERGRVRRTDGNVIVGLYACGNSMASVMGNCYPAPGSCITPGMTFARLAVDDMVRKTA
jgi:3-oxosteroid 1-dehydrogenase